MEKFEQPCEHAYRGATTDDDLEELVEARAESTHGPTTTEEDRGDCINQ